MSEIAPKNCIFCKIIRGTEPATIVGDYEDSIVIVPLNPVVEGHLLVIPRTHVSDFADNWRIAGLVMSDASYHVQQTNPEADYNLITSKGISATQSVFHLHIHLVPRRENDGLALPWYSGKRKKH